MKRAIAPSGHCRFRRLRRWRIPELRVTQDGPCPDNDLHAGFVAEMRAIEDLRRQDWSGMAHEHLAPMRLTLKRFARIHDPEIAGESEVHEDIWDSEGGEFPRKRQTIGKLIVRADG